MIITIAGKPGAGKTAVGQELAAALDYTHISVGDIFGMLAQKKAITTQALKELAKEDTKIDAEIDAQYEELAQKDNLVVDSRLGFYFLKQSVKVFLDVDAQLGAARIFAAKRSDEEQFESVDDVLAANLARAADDRQRFIATYNVDIEDMEQYDIIIDTSELGIKQVVQKIKEVLDEVY